MTQLTEQTLLTQKFCYFKIFPQVSSRGSLLICLMKRVVKNLSLERWRCSGERWRGRRVVIKWRKFGTSLVQFGQVNFPLVSSRKLIRWAQAIAVMQATASIPTYTCQRQRAPCLVVILDWLLATF